MRPDPVSSLLQRGASPQATNKRGRSVLDIAAAAKRPAIQALAPWLKQASQ